MTVLQDWSSLDKYTHIRFSTVTLFSILHKAVAALLAPHQVLHVGHVVETHAPPLPEVAVQVAYTAVTEDSGEWMPGHRHFLFYVAF